MPYCINCNKVLARYTKGERCLKCYQNRNKTIGAENIISNNNLQRDSHDNLSLNGFNLNDITPLHNVNEVEDRAIVEILKGQIDYLKDDIINKNVLIDQLLTKVMDTLDNSSIDNNSRQTTDTLSSTFTTESSNTSSNTSLSNISECSLSDTLFNTKDIADKYDRQIANYRQKRRIDFYGKTTVDNKQFAAWENHSKGFGSKMLKKMGYGGKGLGKLEEGRTHPVIIEKKQSSIRYIKKTNR